MIRYLRRLWHDDAGAIISTELLFVTTILGIGLVVGYTGLRNAIVTEMTELGNALLALSQGFTISGMSGDGGSSDGSGVIDTPGSLQAPVGTPPAIPSVIDVSID